MKQKIKWLWMFTILLVASVFLPLLVHAQGDPFPGCPDPTVACPIDGGLSFLIAAGVVYGVKKVRDGRKKIQAEENI